jgi:hypothetical protein
MRSKLTDIALEKVGAFWRKRVLEGLSRPAGRARLLTARVVDDRQPRELAFDDVRYVQDLSVSG